MLVYFLYLEFFCRPSIMQGPAGFSNPEENVDGSITITDDMADAKL